jgi:hypothetical protein
MYYGVLIGCAFFGVMLAMCFEKLLVMGATAFMGSYAMAMGVGFYAGNFPQVHLGGQELKSIGMVGYVYLGAIAVATVGCYIFQSKREGVRK